MSHLISKSAKSKVVEILHSILCGSERIEAAARISTVSVYTLFAIDNLGQTIERESFYLSTYACPEDRDAEALAWRSAKILAGYQVTRRDDVGEVDRI
jgi:uncharacterized protein YjaG (DUF416 family)